MKDLYDTIVVGLGAMGSAAAYSLARRGHRVLGLDRFTPPHTLGSSHGATRIIRHAYFEHPLYVPLVLAAHRLWQELEVRFGTPLFRHTGAIMIGPRDGTLVAGSRRSAELHTLPYEELSAAEIRRRYPALRPEPEMTGLLEPEAGVLYPEAAIRAFLDNAGHHGARLHFDEPVLTWKAHRQSVKVETGRGTYRGASLLLCAGAWMGRLLENVAPSLEVERNVLHWFERTPGDETLDPDRCPIHIWEYAAERYWYGFPDFGDGVKVALHHEGETTSAEDLRREVGAAEIAGMREILKTYLPAAGGRHLRSTVCMYTNTPDGHFVLDRHPRSPLVWVASCCSGHGFKFASVFGEILADLLGEGKTEFDLTPFELSRFEAASVHPQDNRD